LNILKINYLNYNFLNGSFPLAVAQSLTSDQRYGLVEEMKWAIDSVIYGTPVRSSNGSNTLKSKFYFGGENNAISLTNNYFLHRCRRIPRDTHFNIDV